MGEAGAWLGTAAAPTLPQKPRCSSAWPGVGWDGRLNFFAVQNKIVMETAKIRVWDYRFGVADLFWGWGLGTELGALANCSCAHLTLEHQMFCSLSEKNRGIEVCLWLRRKIEIAKTSGLQGVSVGVFCSLATSAPHCRVEMTGECGFWPLPLRVGQGKVALSVHHCPWVWQPPFCRQPKSAVRIVRGEVLMAAQLSSQLPGIVLMSVYDLSWCLQWFWCNKWTPF